jgi:polyhydroxyalkanoate synthase
VYTENKLRLLRYLPTAERREAVPILLVPSIINRSYILDLGPRRSLVAYLRDQGFDVWMIDWGTPGAEDHTVTLDHHVDGYLRACASEVLAKTGQRQLSLLGYCLGGVLGTLFTALHGELVRNLVALATPIDFHDAGLLSRWARKETFPVELVVDTYGNMPAWLLGTSFKWLRPTSEGRNSLALWERRDDRERRDDFLALSQWAEDNVAVPGETYRKLVKDFYQDNLLVQGRLSIHDHTVALSDIRCPLLTVTAREDHICPSASAAVLNQRVSSEDATLLTLPGGHVGAIVGREATEGWWPTLSQWLAAR